jgi:hypothetical protein
VLEAIGKLASELPYCEDTEGLQTETLVPLLVQCLQKEQ